MLGNASFDNLNVLAASCYIVIGHVGFHVNLLFGPNPVKALESARPASQVKYRAMNIVAHICQLVCWNEKKRLKVKPNDDLWPDIILY